MGDRDEGRLPRWAREELDRQRSIMSTLRKKLESFEDAPEDSPVYYSDFVAGDISLPAKGRYVFRFADGDRLNVQLEDDHLLISGSDGRINVMPQSSNSIRIKVRGLFE